MSNDALVSIGIPTFDRPEMLGLALRSAVEQTHENLDIYVADDGTNPGTEEIVREVAGADKRVRYERNERNLGNYGNGIKVLRAARGEFQKMLLDDDLLAPTHVEKLVAPMVEDDTITLAFSKRTIIDARGDVLPDPQGMSAIAPDSGRISAQALINLCCLNTTNWIGEQTTVLYRRRLVDPRLPVKLAGGVPSGVMGDLAMHLSALAHGDAWYTPEALSSFRQHEGQVSTQVGIHLEAVSDWAMILDRVHLIGEALGTDELITAYGRLIGVTAQNLAAMPHAPAAARAQDQLERMTRHMRALREEGRLVEVPRVSVVLVARGEAQQLLAQLESIVITTPPDSYEVVIATVDPSDEVRAVLRSLEGDIQIVEADGSADPVALASSNARYEIVAALAEDERPVRGWIADLLDERLIAERDTAAQ